MNMDEGGKKHTQTRDKKKKVEVSKVHADKRGQKHTQPTEGQQGGV